MANATSRILIDPINRQMSNLWRIVVSDHDVQRRYIVKRVGAHKERQALVTERQADLLQSFATCLPGDRSFESLYVGFCRDEGLIVLKESTLPVLNDLIIRTGPVQTMRAYPELKAAVRLAGSWLRQWHDANRRPGKIAERLECYIRIRGAKLELLPTKTRREFIKVVQACPDGDVVTTHSDFTTFNILTNGHRLSVVDPGIWEWADMSPCWDLCTFLQSLEEQIRFRWPRPIAWFSAFFLNLQDIFMNAYDSSNLPPAQIFRTCSATRHFINFSKNVDKSRKKSDLYLRKLEKDLASSRELL